MDQGQPRCAYETVGRHLGELWQKKQTQVANVGRQKEVFLSSVRHDVLQSHGVGLLGDFGTAIWFLGPHAPAEPHL